LRKEAEEVALQTKLPLPDYAYQILPRLRFQSTQDSEPFEYQFQPWFDLEAHQARWRRVERVAGLLEGYINVGHLLRTSDRRTWHHGKPIGIKLDSKVNKTKDQALAVAYVYLSVHIDLPVDL
jgi:hypothetical protein